IDSLALVLKECEEVMDQDKDELRLRIQKINASLNKLNQFASDTFSHDFIRSIDQYMAAEKIYSKFIKNASEMSLELNVLKTQLLSLKNSSDKGMFTDEQFTKFLSKERIDILNLHELCEEIAEPINKLEPLYLRTAPRIEAFADSLAKNNIKLK
ncbi:MAG: hypothetical protein HYZ42_13270, partial [Bacteroidetes bacterium]|nr:hypothetical protein [Bacteroidota bacterium]